MTNKTSWLSWPVWIAGLLFWLVIGSVQMGTAFLQNQLEDAQLRAVLRAAAWQALIWFAPYGLATPLLLEWTARLSRSGVARRRFWSRALVVLAACAALHTVLQSVANPPYAAGRLPWWVLGVGVTHAVHYAAILGFGLAVNQRRVAEARERELLAAQLGALRSQLQPHFLFNTLHAISVTGRSDPGAATRMLTLLGDLLRLTLRERDGELVSLAEEQDMLQPYLELQQLRFPGRLRIDLDFPADVLGAAVPDLMLQPLVENALEHGIERRPEGGTVRIAARRWGDQLEIQVADDGAGLDVGSEQVELGVGLGATKERLQVLFGDRAGVSITAGAAGGTTVTVRLPWRELARAA